MNKQELITQLNKIQKEITVRFNNGKLKRYNSGDQVHKKQMQFHKCPLRNRWIFGGNRSGKTEAGAVETLWLARGIHPFRQNKKNVSCWVVSLTREVQRDVAQAKILEYLDKTWVEDVVMLQGKKGSLTTGVIDMLLIKNVFGGISKIGFKSCDQGREKFQGASLDFVWFDEEPPQDVYEECKMRVLDTAGELFGTMTPLKGLTWVYEEIYKNKNNDPDVWHIHMNWEDNPFLNTGEVTKLSKTMNQQELTSRKYGQFTGLGGMVYCEFDEQTNVIDPFTVPPDWFDAISIDPGLNNPLSAHWYAVDYDGNIYVIAEHYEAGKSVEYHAEVIKKISSRLGWHKASNGMIGALIDSAANQKTLASQKSVSELFYDNGILVNAQVNKDLFSGINRVKSYFKNANGESRLFIFKTCVHLIREIKGYFWGQNESPVKKDDHALDELRYYIMSRPENKPKEQKSLIQKDKERLYKKIKSSGANQLPRYF